MKKSLVALLLACFAFVAGAKTELSWSEPFALPSLDGNKVNPGVARPFAGEHNGVVLLAGGGNFPDKPLTEGGKKKFHREVYAMTVGSNAWRRVGELPVAGGEGASTTVPQGVFCVGGAAGETGAELSAKCFLMKWNGSVPQFKELPDFPYPVRMPGIASQGSRVFVAGGWHEAPAAESDVWTLDLAEENARWKPLPRLPEMTEQPVAVVQNLSMQRTALFVFPGMKAHQDGMQLPQKGGWFLTLAPEAATEWQSVPEISVKGNPEASRRTMVGASAVASGDQHILFFGGVDREIMSGQMLHPDPEYFHKPNEWFRFGTSVLVYHTVTEQWFEKGVQPIEGRAGASVMWLSDGSLLLTNGEIGPGIRSPTGVTGRFAKAGTFHPVNLAVIVLYFIAMAVMGVWFMRRNKNADDYFKGGGRLPWWAVCFSLYATMFSSITFLSIPAMSYLSDCRYAAITIGIITLAPIVTHFYLPFFRKLNLTSAYEFLEVRFNLACRLFASAAFTLFMIARTAVVTYLPAVAIAAVVDVDVNVAIVIVTLVTILYCTLGGIEAVVWSDFVQSVILIAGLFIIFFFLVSGTDGGFSGFIGIGAAANKFRVFDFALDWGKPVFWVVALGGIVANLASYTSDQCVVQRYMTTKDEKGAAKSILVNGVLSFFNSLLFFALGVAIYTFHVSNPQLLDVTMPKNDSVFPIFIADSLPVGISGLILAALAAATMSTLSANLNSAASAVATDFFARLVPNATEKGRFRCGQIATVATGILGGLAALALANMQIYSIYDQFQRFLGILTGGLGCLFLMGVFMKKVNGIGALAGLLANYAVCITLDQCNWSGKPHLLLYGALGMIVCLIVAPVVSFFTTQGNNKCK